MGALNIIEYFVQKEFYNLFGSQFLVNLAVIITAMVVFFNLKMDNTLGSLVGVLLVLFLLSFNVLGSWATLPLIFLVGLFLTVSLKPVLSGGGFK